MNRTLHIVGSLLFAITVAVDLVSIFMNASISGVAVLNVAPMFPLPLLGGLMVWKKPRHPVGWLMLGLGTAVAGASASSAFLDAGGTSPEAAGVAQLFNHLSFASMVGLFALLLLLFPTGKPSSHRWRILVRVAIGAIVLIAVSGMFGTPDDASEARSPLAIEGAQTVLAALGGVGLVSALIAIVGGGVSVIWRLRFADATERAQIKWFAFAVAILVVLLLGSFLPVFDTGPRGDQIFDAILVLITGVVMPGCIAIAILKHRLYDIDVLVNRTLVYGALTAVLATSYLATVVLLQRLFEPFTQESDVAIAASTLAVAALFRPLRSRVQRFIDHRFYRRRYNARLTLESFSSRLREDVDLEHLAADLTGVVKETMQPTHASLWIRPTAEIAS